MTKVGRFLVLLLWGLGIAVGMGTGALRVVIAEIQGLGSVVGTVEDVFGDPVPGARVRLADKEAWADEQGRFTINVPLGRQTLMITAPGYQPLELNLHVDRGENKPRISQETGLWPVGFKIDYHLFYQGKGQGEIKDVFGLVGFANGTNEEYFIHSIKVLDPFGDVVIDLLAELDDYRDFAGTYTDSNFALDPQMAAIIYPRTVILRELPSFTADVSSRSYTLQVLYGTEEEHSSGKYWLWEKTIAPVLDEDCDPHVGGNPFLSSKNLSGRPKA
ncbi:MAG: carboxypeptidase regulatory-like domain-containing protein [Firmicutes bacterium]|nr:carboxypeptidase regulatory-like domain-containing protein [Bacillota bacterium]